MYQVKDFYPFFESLNRTQNLIVNCGPGFKTKQGITGVCLERVALRIPEKSRFMDALKKIEEYEVTNIVTIIW